MGIDGSYFLDEDGNEVIVYSKRDMLKCYEIVSVTDFWPRLALKKCDIKQIKSQPTRLMHLTQLYKNVPLTLDFTIRRSHLPARSLALSEFVTSQNGVI